MSGSRSQQRGLAVPTGRFNRLARLGGMTTSVAGRMAANGGLELLRGRKPKLTDLLLTPSNAARVADELSRMRGAAMKAGQLLSMETADMLPPEMASIMARLRADAHFMPPAQLKKVLAANWGADFLKNFRRFDVHPIAAASIGQVHRAQTKDGRDLAIKVQYPGVRDSINSDMRNLGMILRAAGVLPKGFDLDRLMKDACEQLHEETDYAREADALRRFQNYLKANAFFLLPDVHSDLSTPDILVMDYLDAEPIEALASAEQSVRDDVATKLISLTLEEAFELRDMQTDPNFANYQYNRVTGQVILLDFGATRQFSETLSAKYLALFQAAVSADNTAAFDLMIQIGLVGEDMSAEDRAHILRLFDIAAEPLRAGGVLDFRVSDLLPRLRRDGLVLAEEQVAIHAPPTDTLLFQRKVLGCYLLAERLKARVDLTPLIARYQLT